MIYFVICTLFLAPRIFASSAPRIIYSAVIYNVQDSPIQCSVIWSQPPPDPTLESGLFTIEKHDYYIVKSKVIQLEGWEANGIIQQIRCGNLLLSAPFDKVTSPEKNWKFRVESDEIISVGPSSSHTYN
ncbi:unnamed protein product [Rotaria sp. Silwood2]|nr:unnamed protein product [Rotaria sp. Silwood2]CAF4368031.1 unnamed protein product [Rotaria sp. Silwood2]